MSLGTHEWNYNEYNPMHKSIFVCHRKLRTNLEIILLEVDSCTKYCTKPHSTTIPHHTINVAHNLSQPTRMLRQRLQPYVLLTNLIVYWPWSYSYFILTTYLHRLWSPSIPYLHSYLPNRVWLEVHNFLTPQNPIFYWGTGTIPLSTRWNLNNPPALPTKNSATTFPIY